MDFRVSILPTLFGEKVVMRLLDKSNLQLDMTKLGFEENRSSTSRSHTQAVRYGPGDRPHRFRKNHDPVQRPF